MPNQDESRVSKMSWSMVSKAAERSRRQRQESFCKPIALMRCRGCIRETFQWNGAVGKQTGEDAADCEKIGDQ